MKGGILAGLGAIVAILVAIWLFVVVVKVALKLIGLALILGLAAIVYFVVKDRIGGGNAR
jgi:predicted membrane-bound spermidine synthase